MNDFAHVEIAQKSIYQVRLTYAAITKVCGYIAYIGGMERHLVL